MAPLDDLPDDHDISHLLVAYQYCRRFRTAIDGGAHRGIWSRHMATRFECVIAFEPVPAQAERIRGATAVWTAALGPRRGTVNMQAGTENTGQWHVNPHGDLTVEQMPLDELDLPDVDFLKLDVEGYELPALQGAEETIERCRPTIMLEKTGAATPAHRLVSTRYGYDESEIDAWLDVRGYRSIQRMNKDYLYVPLTK